MKVTLDYILYTQSPTLFLAAVIFLLAYFLRRREHKFCAVLELIACIACIALGVALYFIGMDAGLFTIKDFWHVRTPAWIGMAAVLLGAVLSLLRTVQRFFRRRSAQRAAARSERDRKQQLENTWKDAYASGMADAMAAESRAKLEAESAQAETEAIAPEAENAPGESEPKPEPPQE